LFGLPYFVAAMFRPGGRLSPSGAFDFPVVELRHPFRLKADIGTIATGPALRKRGCA
jgi:hypothetical protein